MAAIKSHVRFSNIRSRLVRTLLVEAFATSRLMFGCVIWGHVFGAKLLLRRMGGTPAARIETAHHRHLRWALRVPKELRTSFLLLLANQLPFQGLVTK